MAKLTYTCTTGGAPLLLRQFSQFMEANELHRHLKRVRQKFRNRLVTSAPVQERYAIPLGLGTLYGRQVNAAWVSKAAAEPQLHAALSFMAGVVEISRLAVFSRYSGTPARPSPWASFARPSGWSGARSLRLERRRDGSASRRRRSAFCASCSPPVSAMLATAARSAGPNRG